MRERVVVSSPSGAYHEALRLWDLGCEVVGARLLHRVAIDYRVGLSSSRYYRGVLRVRDRRALVDDGGVARGPLAQGLGIVPVALLVGVPARPPDAGQRERDRRVYEAKQRVGLPR